MTFAYAGKIIKVNLQTKEIRIENTDTNIMNKYLGGRGFGIYYLFNNLKRNIDPLGRNNILIIATGPLCGTLAPSSNRYSIITKSPLTGGIGYSNSGGHFAPELKYAGYDAIIIEKVSDEPVYLYIENNKVELKDATHLWGKDTFETDNILRSESPSECQILYIGQGGENLVKYSSILNNHSRAAARTGVGAVMGSKKLKAIVVKGNHGIKVAEPIKFNRKIDETINKIKNDPAFPALSEYGTSFLVDLAHIGGGLATRNNQTGVFDGYEGISSEEFYEKYRVKSESCFACPIHCGKYSRVKSGEYKSQGGSPEYEAIVCLGSKCGVDKLDAIIYANELCNRYGLDSISVGDTIAFAMEAYEKGIITEEMAGMKLEWGNADILIELIKKIAFREGIGDLLAEGTKHASEQLPGSEDFALHVKGMEPPAYDVRTAKAFGLGWATATRGADHLAALPNFELLGYKKEVGIEWFGSEKAVDPYAWESKPYMVYWHENFGAVVDSAEMCKYTCFSAYAVKPKDMVEFINYAIGSNYLEEDIMKIGERIYNLERLFNLREGIGKDGDNLPKRFTHEKLPEGPAKGNVVELDKMMPIYYRHRSWDLETGYPSKEKLIELGLERYLPKEGKF